MKTCPNHPARLGNNRGLCVTCYGRAWYRVKIGAATWKQMETRGEVLPPNRTGRPRKAIAAAGSFPLQSTS